MSRRLDTLFREKSSQLLSFIRKRIGNPGDAEDLLQDLFTRAAENLDALSPVENLGAWIWTAARNRIIDYYRSKQTWLKRESSVVPGTLEGEDDLMDDRSPGVEDALLREEMIDALYESLDELPPEQREVFLLQAVDGRTFAEISELTGVSINTLTARKRYALRFLRRRLANLKVIFDEMEH
ncbi:sigma-70 family RNA polymerase sigma factor [Marispirochaeta aestuarii]|uniref:RNA polymerase sigma factor n=1 Tax=Marispirochaeta aestuarii TaxID=1963862 RepID=UPI0029C9AEB7|nr:sigma-70 family RNA polymerase sigma factor [Marispirochaeta aestuarii]